MGRSIVAFALALLATSPAAGQCVRSEQGTYSFGMRLSPRAGIRCLMIADVYDGASCEPSRRTWSVELGCNESRRMAISDRGRLVSILAPRTSQPAWDIVRVCWHDGTAVRYGSARAEELTSLRRARVSFDGSTVRFESRGQEPVRVPFETIEALVEPRGRPRDH